MVPPNLPPGIYIEENFDLPPSVEPVETAIPAFIGYTEKAQLKEVDDLLNKPWRIGSMNEYEQFFGFPDPEKESLSVTFTNIGAKMQAKGTVEESKRSKYLMYYSLQMYFANGGGPCWITSVGYYDDSKDDVNAKNLLVGLAAVAAIDEVTLLLFPDAVNLASGKDFYNVYEAALNQCASLYDRFTILDVYHNPLNGDNWNADIQFLRDTLFSSVDALKYGAVYFPKIYTDENFYYGISGDQRNGNDASVTIVGGAAGNLSDLKIADNTQYQMAMTALSAIPMLLPASSAIAGIYATVDKSYGVWKAPANINITNAVRPEFAINQQEQEGLNVDSVTGKSINVIREFAGRGPAIVWGARTLAGNDYEWRYISVRRFCSMVEASARKATEPFIFESNDSNTWTRVKAMIENYLMQLWKAGALMGTQPNEAFFVHVGLGETMTQLDIEEGRMIIIIGLAVVRPAEFILIRFSQAMLPNP